VTVDGLNVAVIPGGAPETESETGELNPATAVSDTDTLALVPVFSSTDVGAVVIEKSGFGFEFPNTMFVTGWISIPLGAMPVWPCRKSNIAIPVIWTGTFAV
jgi:hypothetical protein